jgi:ubiquitin-like modifier-activating enzyme ATG7
MMVDQSFVKFNNPTRQWLFNYEDADNRVHKAKAAVDNLSKISPTIVASYHDLSIPMPGHPITDEVRFKKIIDDLDDLINEADTVFLLTDSRESRWLPTLLCSAKNKLLINIALGFDSYLVMRYGKQDIPTNTDTHSVMGCYFCNDIVAPINSLENRTLDQQCTVTRPGLSPIASAIGVELLVSIMHEIDDIPHTIRGNLIDYQNKIMFGHQYDKCTACSSKIVDEYKKDTFGFLQKCINEPNVLEELSGIKTMKDTDVDVLDFD